MNPATTWTCRPCSGWNTFYRTGRAALCWSRMTDSCWMPSPTAAGSCAIKRCTTLPFRARQARQALEERDESDAQRHKAEQKEIDRVTASAKRLATWGRVYDNEDLARKAKQMEKQVERLKESQTALTAGSPWRLSLRGDALPADRLLEMEQLAVPPATGLPALFHVPLARLKSGDRVAIVGRNGCGKSSLMRLIWRRLCTAKRLRCGCIRVCMRAITTRRCISWRMTPRCSTRWSRLLRIRRIAKWH